MEKYIPLNALVAEIERRISLFKKEKKTEKWSAEASQMNVISLGARIAMLEEILSLLDTLEVKEVEFDEEADNYWETLTSDVKDSIYFNDFYKIAKHFFELGLKAQKGEKV